MNTEKSLSKTEELLLEEFDKPFVKMKNNKGKIKEFEPVFCTIYRKCHYVILRPLFKSELGENTVLIFKHCKDKSFSPVKSEKIYTAIYSKYINAYRENARINK